MALTVAPGNPWRRSRAARQASMWSETDKEKQRLILVESETYANGIVKLVYDVVR